MRAPAPRTPTPAGQGFIESWGEEFLDSNVVDGALAELNLARNGHALVGHFFSHFTKSLYALMTGRRGVAPPFVSVDGGGMVQLQSVLQPLPEVLGNGYIRRRRGRS